MEPNNYKTRDVLGYTQPIPSTEITPASGLATAMQAEVGAPVPASVTPEIKENKNRLLALLLLGLCLLLAMGGVGFGIWSLLSSSERENSLGEQISSLKNQNTELLGQIEELQAELDMSDPSAPDVQVPPEPKYWSSTEVRDGLFSVLDANGEVIAQSNVQGVSVNEIIGCEQTADNTVLTCTASTSAGNGWFLYDVYGDSVVSSFDAE